MSKDEIYARQVAARVAADRTRSRLSIAMVACLVLFGILFARLIEVTAFRQGVAQKHDRTEQELAFYRADIVDRNGEILATDLQGASLFADARVIWDPVETAHAVKSVLPGIDEASVRKKLETRQAFVWIKRNVSPNQQQAVRQLGIPGLYFKQEPRRVYPNGRTASHVLGFVNVDNHGLAGVERGAEELILDRRNHGEVVELSLDIRVQHAVEDELSNAMVSFNARAATGIVLDVESGEVLALASLPDFDPNEPASAKQDAHFNRGTLGLFEMGSTFKTFTTAMALDSHKVTLTTEFDASVPLNAGRYTISDFHPENRVLSVPEVFVHSSNIGSAKMALAIGTSVQRSYLAKFGLLTPIAMEIKEMAVPLVPRSWGELETMTVAYGHGLAVTPMHLAMANAAVVNGGRLVRPTFLKRPARSVTPYVRVIDAATSGQMRDLMRMVVTQGTGLKADVPGYPVGGKTGTAEKVAGRGYDPSNLLTSFVGVFPSKSPRYLVLVVLDEPKPNEETQGFATAGWNAAPTTGKIIARIAPMLNVPVTADDPAKPAATTMASYQDLH